MYLDPNGNNHSLSTEELRDIIFGRTKWKKCYECDKGIIYVDYEGCIVTPEEYAKDKDNMVRGYCSECSSVGLILIEEDY